MTDIIKFALIGLATGGIYALLGMGTTLIYRGSGIINFAQGGLALVGASVVFELKDDVPGWVAVLCAVLAAALVGVLIQLLVLRPMRVASPLSRVIATLGVLIVLQEAAHRRYGDLGKFVHTYLPDGTFHPFGSVRIGQDRMWIFAIAVILTLVLWVTYRFSAFGVATTAVAESERVASAAGWSPQLIATLNWGVGGALGGLAGALLVPITGLTPTVMTLTIVPALTAGLVGSFASFPLTLAGGLILGVLESEATLFQTRHSHLFGVPTIGFVSTVSYIMILVLIIARGRAIPLRGYLTDRLPRLGPPELKWRSALVVGAVVVVGSFFLSSNWLNALITSCIFGLLALSLVIVTGYGGQLSLAQFSFAGLGALFAGRMGDAWSIPFPAALVLAVLFTMPIGMILALPAIRARGVNLAVATLALSLVVSSLILANPSYTGGPIRGTVLPSPRLFGLNIDSVKHPLRYALVGFGLLVIAAFAVANLRRGKSGRRLIAIRENERAAASLGISVVGAKLWAFGLGSGFAAAAGVLIAFRNSHVEFDQFDALGSVEVILYAVLGSIGFISGALIGGASAPSGIGQQLVSEFWDVRTWVVLILAVLVVLTVIVHPDGIAENTVKVFRSRFGRRKRVGAFAESALMPASTPSSDIKKVAPKVLDISDVTVTFGTTRAVNRLSFSVQPGEVVGLIGPNGAGKTTVVDVATGFLRNYQGSVSLGGAQLDGMSAMRRSRTGLTRSFQSLELFEDLTVAENLLAACEHRDLRSYVTDLVRPRKPRLSAAAIASVQEFELESVLGERPSSLSYAQRRAVGIARAVATAPSVLLLDEPAAGLDAASTRELSGLIRRLATEWGMAILLIEHDVSMVLSTCDRVVAINFGQEIATGTPDEIRTNAGVVEAYLGEQPAGVASSSVAEGTI